MDRAGRRRSKKQLEGTFEEQLRDIHLSVPLTHPPIHPYLDIWLACKRFAGGFGGMMLPESGGYLDQDAELMFAFMLLDDINGRLDDEDKRREEALKGRNPKLSSPHASPHAPFTQPR